MLVLNSPNKITFDVNVQGTASTPSVKCIVGEQPGFIYPAVKLADGKFEVLIELPESVQAGSYPFKIDVLLNGRLFTPINTQIDVVQVQTESTIESTSESAPESKSEAISDLPIEIEPVKQEPKKPASIIQQITKEEKTPKTKSTGKLSALEIMAKSIKPPKKSAKVVDISIASIANEAAHRETPSLDSQIQNYSESLDIQTTIPTSLIKGKIIYK